MRRPHRPSPCGAESSDSPAPGGPYRRPRLTGCSPLHRLGPRAQRLRHRHLLLHRRPASTGRPSRRLPPGFAVPILVVQHISGGFLKGLIRWISGQVAIPVREAADGSRIELGVTFAASDAHMTVGRNGLIAFDRTTVSGYHRPSGDILLASLAAAFGPRRRQWCSPAWAATAPRAWPLWPLRVDSPSPRMSRPLPCTACRASPRSAARR